MTEVPIVTFNDVDHTGEIDEILGKIYKFYPKMKYFDEIIREEILENENSNVILSLLDELGGNLQQFDVDNSVRILEIKKLLEKLGSPIS